MLFFLVSIAFLAWIAKMVLGDKELRFKRTPLDVPVLVFLFVAILSAVFSVDKSSSLLGFYGRFSDGLIGLLSFGAMFFLITNNVKPENGLLKTFKWSVFFVILFSYLSIFGIWAQFNNLLGTKFQLPQMMTQRTFNPATGSMEGLAVFLGIIIVFLVGLILSQKSKAKSQKFFDWLLLIASLVLIMLVDFTPAWILLLVSLFLLVGFALGKRIFREKVNRLLLPIFLIIIAGVFLFVDTSNLQSSILNLQLPKEQVLDQAESWGIGFKAATENVKSGFLGSGIGTWHYDFSKFKPAEFSQNSLWQIRFDRSGNYITEILGTTGFLGILSYLFLISFFLMMGYFFCLQNQVSLPLLMAFLALLVGQFVYYQNTTLAFIFWLILGLSVASWLSTKAGGEAEKTVSLKDFPELSLIFSTLLIVLGLVIFGMYFFAGKFYLADINYKNAVGTNRIEKLEKAAVLNPYQSQYRSILARVYLNEALNEAMKPIEKQNSEALTKYVNRAINYSKGGEIIDERGNIIRITGATELSPNRVFNWEIRGTIYRDIQTITAGATDWGIKAFEKAIELEPTNPVLYTELGKLLVIEKPEQAKEKFAKALELQPDYLDTQVQQALIAESEGKRDEAIKKMEELSLTYPFEVEIFFQLGRLYFNNNQIDEAIPQFKKAIDLAPFHSNALYSLGVAYEAKGEKDLAIKEFEKVLELNPGNADVLSKLEELRAEEEKKEEE